MLGIINIFVVFFVSVMVSIIGNVIGIGGGVMLVPFFILYLHLTSVVASGLSLFTIVISTLGGAYAFIKQKIFNYKLFIVLIFSILPGVIVGSIINKFVNTQQFKFIFPFWVIFIGIFSLISTKRQPKNKEAGYAKNQIVKHNRLIKLISFIAGFVSGFFGVGIGGIMGTYLITIEEISAKIAFPTLIMVMAITSFIGFVTHYISSDINLLSWVLYIVPLSIGAIFGSQIGVYISKISNVKALRLYQGWIILILGCSILFLNVLGA